MSKMKLTLVNEDKTLHIAETINDMEVTFSAPFLKNECNTMICLKSRNLFPPIGQGEIVKYQRSLIGIFIRRIPEVTDKIMIFNSSKLILAGLGELRAGYQLPNEIES